MARARYVLLFILLLGTATGCASHLSTPLDWRSLETLKDISRDRAGSLNQDGRLLGTGHSFSFSPRRISFVSDQGTVQDVVLDSPLTFSVHSRAAGAKTGFWIGAAASAGLVLAALLEMERNDINTIEPQHILGSAGVGLVGGSVGALIGYSVGGYYRFKIGGS